jgi:tetratricopeptide (TPR) repeat protein
MTAWQPRLRLEEELKKADTQLAATPNDVEMRFNRATLLSDLGQVEEAKKAYIEMLALSPSHFGALNNLGALLVATGYNKAARITYAEAVKYHPDKPDGHINLANALARNLEMDAAIKHFRIALQLDPYHFEAHQGLAHLLTSIGDEENAKIHREKGFRQKPILLFPYKGSSLPVPLLVLTASTGGTVPIRQHIDDRIFFTSVLFVDFYDPELPFPPHMLVFNAIGDADASKPALEAAMEILKRSKAPVINPPSAVLKTGRAANAERLAHIPGVITAKMQLLPRAYITAEKLAKLGFTFPLLLRSPGFHTGHFFVRCENPESLATTLPSMPGPELMVIQYLDARSADGKIRKYRVMMIAGKIYPLHAAISHEWKIHYFSAEMADNPENRAEDAAFLEDMPKVLGPRAMQALEKIQETLGLQYAGADFSLSPDGDVILFEANATMVVNPPDADPRWDYRRPAVKRVTDAIRQLFIPHAA